MVSKSNPGKKTGTSAVRKTARKRAAPGDSSPPPQPHDPMVQVRLIATSPEELKRFIESTPMKFACAGPRVNKEGIATAHVLMKGSTAKEAQRSDAVRLEIIADPSDMADEGLPDVGSGNRFEDPSVLPVGRGKLLRKPS
ncbi:hypothetical protein AWB81_04635 [Caballeronia arationis]|jgi:hypothetical protein|uniref:Uncharacterized protein n=1 Tax=Caballeronia arationis TaxID=1777142 RepID=A0A7Z7IFB5_9BURK|nr:hypothetical protein [Caballeronia arationis]SAK88260.1 hypothetical protein AWB81_04635 [Caballeronia arationis]SOE88836.1 hypothetical protein SAMN05446927_7461 [Caballeronia arationis]